MRKNLINIFLEKNQQLNLSAIRDEQGVMTKHILDSIELNKIFKLGAGKKVCDIGTGGGFPLLPLSMTNTNVNFTGIDARKKKVEAVNEMIKNLGIQNAKCIWTRIEEFTEQFDYITARAVGYIDKIIPRSYNILKKGGLFIFYKQFDEQEFETLKNLCKKYNLKIKEKHEYSLFDGDIKRIIYIIEKI